MNGVYFNNQRQQWHARTTIKGKRYHVGYFRSELAGLRGIDDFVYDFNHPDTGIMRKVKLEIEGTYADKEEREKFSPFKWLKRELTRITRR